MSENNPALRLINLQYHIPVYEGLLRRQNGRIRIIDGISLDVLPGETVAIVGEKGSGKTTLGRTIMHLFKPTGGQILFNGTNLVKLKSSALRQQRQKLQMVFQDPYTALNPRMTIGELLTEPLEIHRQGTDAERQARVHTLLHQVGLNSYVARHYPHEIAGGSRQRVSIARALITQPSFLILDEPTRALDTAVSQQILQLLQELKAQFQLTYLLFTSSMAAAVNMANRIYILYGGQIVEASQTNLLRERPLHPYTQALAAAMPLPDPAAEARRQHYTLTGTPPNPTSYPGGCRFHPRCPIASDICSQQAPTLQNLGTSAQPHLVACHHAHPQ